MRQWAVLADVLLFVGCGEDVAVTVERRSEPHMEAVCGFRNPEDLGEQRAAARRLEARDPALRE